VALLWEFMLRRDFPECRTLILGTDGELSLLRRAQDARYPASALRDLPADWLRAFERRKDQYQLQIQYRTSAHFAAHDLRTGPPGGCFDLLLCRNLAFTYWDEALQLEAVRNIERALRSGGVLVVGAHEGLPPGSSGLIPRPDSRCMFDRR
jgi:chemotaxis protein methyltransferase CheR